MKRILKVFVILVAFAAVTTGIYACELGFTLLSDDGTNRTVSPDRETVLSLGTEYTLVVDFTQDHKNCITPPEATQYYLDEERWKSSKEYLPLEMISQGEWVPISQGVWEQKILFTVKDAGEWELEIIRDCPKGGYNESLIFTIQ